MTMHDTTAGPASVREYLEEVAYPTQRHNLIEHARARGAPVEVLRALEGIPEREYDSAKEVAAAVGGNSPPTPSQGSQRDSTEVARPVESTTNEDPGRLALGEKPTGAPGGIAGRASDEEREDPVVMASDDSFPASDPPSH